MLVVTFAMLAQAAAAPCENANLDPRHMVCSGQKSKPGAHLPQPSPPLKIRKGALHALVPADYFRYMGRTLVDYQAFARAPPGKEHYRLMAHFGEQVSSN